MGFIRGYNDGDDITLLNVIYHKPKKISENQYRSEYTKDSIDIIFKDMKTGKKHVQHIEEPKYTYYILDDETIPANYHRFFIEKDRCRAVTCRYTDLKKSIAEETGNTEFFYANIQNGNYRENDRLFQLPVVFGADMNIEDYYRWLFARTYKNEYSKEKTTKLYFDIEADTKTMKGDFPEPGECPVNAITLVDDANFHIYTLLLENYDNPLIEEFKKEKGVLQSLKEFVRERVGGWKEEVRYGLDKFQYHIMFYDEEANMIHDMFDVINKIQPDFALAWNIAFDLPYLIARIQNLGYDPVEFICHPDFKVKECYYFVDKRAEKFEERGDYAQVSCYTVYLDQLITFASRRKGQRAVGSYKLDYIGEMFANVGKLDYSAITTSLTELPYIDYRTFVFYNVMDTIVQLCVEHKVGDVDFVYSKSLLTNTRYSKVHRQTVYLINIITNNFWNETPCKVMGCNVNKSNQKEGFAGAFVADPVLVSEKPKMKVNGMPILLCLNCVDFD